jgi:hypothetical protein
LHFSADLLGASSGGPKLRITEYSEAIVAGNRDRRLDRFERFFRNAFNGALGGDQ